MKKEDAEVRTAHPSSTIVSDPDGRGHKRGPNIERPTDVKPKESPAPKGPQK